MISLIGKPVKFQWSVMKEASLKSSVPMQKREIFTYLVTRQNIIRVKSRSSSVMDGKDGPNTGSIIT